MEEDVLKKLFEGVVLEKEQLPDKESIRLKIWESIESHKHAPTERHVLKRYWQLIAASVIIILGTTIWLGSEIKFEKGEDLYHLILPDGSLVTLQEDAGVRSTRLSWMLQRNVHLKGNAEFEVTKGGRFQVKTSRGVITVLGTRFTIVQEAESMLVSCYEGSVSVQTKAGEEILHPGEEVMCNNEGLFPGEIQVPLPEYLEYTNTPLSEIFGTLSDIFGLEIQGCEPYEAYTFTGYLPTSDMEEAIEVLSGSCGFTYKLHDSELKLGRSIL